MKKSLLLLLFVFLSTGCLERGYTLKTVPVHASTINITPAKAINIPSKTEGKKVAKELNVLKKSSKNTLNTKTLKSEQKILNEKSMKHNDTLFPLSDETKNKISGFFIILISIIILL